MLDQIWNTCLFYQKKKKSNAIATNYFATFLQIVDVANF